MNLVEGVPIPQEIEQVAVPKPRAKKLSITRKFRRVQRLPKQRIQTGIKSSSAEVIHC